MGISVNVRSGISVIVLLYQYRTLCVCELLYSFFFITSAPQLVYQVPWYVPVLFVLCKKNLADSLNE